MSIDPKWLTEARRDLGVAEGPGTLNNETVLGYYAETGNAWVREDSVPWCAAFVGAMLRRAGRAIPAGGDALRARAYASVATPLRGASPGALAIFRRGKDPAQGHIGFYIGATATHVIVLGGNQADTVSIARYPRARLIGYYWPKPDPAIEGMPARPPSPSPRNPVPPAPRTPFAGLVAGLRKIFGG